MKKLFTVQYSSILDKFFLSEKENPVSGEAFEIPIIDCENGSTIQLGAMVIDTEKIECSFPNKQVFANPFNEPALPIHYGYLYNWYAVEGPNFAPPGWHLPTVNEFEELFAQVGGTTYGGLLKSTLPDTWSLPNRYAENYGNFNLLPAGARHWYEGDFRAMFTNTALWTRNHEDLTYLASYEFFSNGRAASLQSPVANYGFSVRFIKDDNINPGTINDLDGNEYPTVKINNQVWLAENWRCTRFNNGNPIPNVQDDIEWTDLNSPAYCAYNNDDSLV